MNKKIRKAFQFDHVSDIQGWQGTQTAGILCLDRKCFTNLPERDNGRSWRSEQTLTTKTSLSFNIQNNTLQHWPFGTFPWLGTLTFSASRGLTRAFLAHFRISCHGAGRTSHCRG